MTGESERRRFHPAATLTGAGLLATTGLFGVGIIAPSNSGAIVGLGTVNSHAGAGNIGNAANDNSAVTDTNSFAFAGTFGIASKHRCGTGNGFLGLGACVTPHEPEP